jgi:selenide,water dikinase
METSLINLSLGAGCGCKIDAAELGVLLRELSGRERSPDLLVGVETADDCAVWRISDERYLLFTTDFFTPPVDDPYDYGRIAAANAVSDVYAMGGRPLSATVIFGYPPDVVGREAARAILRGGLDVMSEVGCTVSGGHTIKNHQPVFGFSVVGEVPAAHLKTNAGAHAGDHLVLTRALGVGVFSNALQQGLLAPEEYVRLRPSLLALNRVGQKIGALSAVSAMTDVTGFGLLGHALEMAEGAGLALDLDARAVPLLDGTSSLAPLVFSRGSGASRNLVNAGGKVAFPDALDHDARLVLADPQSNGGLLVAVAPEGLDELLSLLRREPHATPAVVGRFQPRGSRTHTLHVQA